MLKAIAGRGRACQAALLCLLFSTSAAVKASGTGLEQNPAAAANSLPTIRAEAEGITFEEACAPASGANSFAPCGTLARQAADVVRRLTPLLGPCPRKEVRIYVVPGRERPGRRARTTAPEPIILPERLARAASHPEYFPDVLPSEIARLWFLPLGFRAYGLPMEMAEVIAQYVSWRYVLETNPEAARVMVAEAMRDTVAHPYPRTLDELSNPFFSITNAAFGGGPDKRGLLVMRTLETVIDRERVDRVLREYVRRHGRAPFSVADFQRVCEEVSGRKLGWFFRYFFEGTRIPTIELRSLPAESPGVAAGEIVVKDFPPEGSVRVEMTVRTAQGIVEHSVATRGPVTPFTVNVPAPALAITLDPDLRILRWTAAAVRWKAQSALLARWRYPITQKNLPKTIDLYRRALAADPDDASRRAQSLHESLGELESAHQEWDAALMDLDAAVNGHSLGLSETYLCRAKAYVYRGFEHLRRGQKKEALEDARAGLDLPHFVLLQGIPRAVINSPNDWPLLEALKSIRDRAAQN